MKLEHVDRILPGPSASIQQQPNHPLRKFFRQYEADGTVLSFSQRRLAGASTISRSVLLSTLLPCAQGLCR
jgi:hypothetical protein